MPTTAIWWSIWPHGLGIATGPCFIVRPYLLSGRLQRVLPDYTTDVLNIHAVYPTRKHLSAKVRIFVNFSRNGWRARGWAERFVHDLPREGISGAKSSAKTGGYRSK